MSIRLCVDGPMAGRFIDIEGDHFRAPLPISIANWVKPNDGKGTAECEVKYVTYRVNLAMPWLWEETPA